MVGREGGNTTQKRWGKIYSSVLTLACGLTTLTPSAFALIVLRQRSEDNMAVLRALPLENLETLLASDGTCNLNSVGLVVHEEDIDGLRVRDTEGS